MSNQEKTNNIDQETKDFCIDKLQDIIETMNILKYETRVSELNGGLPTLLIGLEKNYKNADTIGTCTFLPMNFGDSPYLILQYNVVLNVKVPEDKISEIKDFIMYVNSQFLVGTLMLHKSELSLKHAVYVNSEDRLDRISVARTLEILNFEADEALKKVDKFIDGSLTVSQFIKENTPIIL